MLRELTYLQAIREAHWEEMARDPDVIVMGQDMRANLYGAYAGLAEEFGGHRVRDLPTSETACVGAAAGAAMVGLRPIVDMTIASFVFVAMDQFVNQVAKDRYMHGGQVRLPVVYRACMYFHGATAAQHSDRPYPMFMQVPGIKIVVPATPADVKGLLKAAVRSDDPVMCFEDSSLWRTTGPVSDDDVLVPIGQADVKRIGTDLTVVAIGRAVGFALAAADEVAARGISAEVIDPRTVAPLDWETIFESVGKTRRLVVVDSALRTCSAASEISATVSEELFDALEAPICRVTAPDVHTPFSPALESNLYPDVHKITNAISTVVGERIHGD